MDNRMRIGEPGPVQILKIYVDTTLQLGEVDEGECGYPWDGQTPARTSNPIRKNGEREREQQQQGLWFIFFSLPTFSSFCFIEMKCSGAG